MDVILDDRLLIEELLSGIEARGAALHTTTYWYYRACRAATLGAGGYLSGPFTEVPNHVQSAAIAGMLRLPSSIGLPDPRRTVPFMVDLSERHPQLNLLNLEAAAFAMSLQASVWLSHRAATGVLPPILDAERIEWLELPVSAD